MFFDDWKYDFLVRVVSFENVLTTPAIPSQYTYLALGTGYSPLDIATFFTPLATLPSQDHLSESLIPLSSLLGGSEDQERSQSAQYRNPPLELDPKPSILSGPGPNPSRDLIDPSEISVNDVPARPNDRPSRDLRNKITDGDHRG